MFVNNIIAKTVLIIIISVLVTNKGSACGKVALFRGRKRYVDRGSFGMFRILSSNRTLTGRMGRKCLVPAKLAILFLGRSKLSCCSSRIVGVPSNGYTGRVKVFGCSTGSNVRGAIPVINVHGG